MNKNIRVIKRNGISESWDSLKYKKTLDWGVENVNGVDSLKLQDEVSLTIRDGIKSTELMEASITAAKELITSEESNWTKVAGKLMIMDLNKTVKRNCYDTFGIVPHEKFSYDDPYNKLTAGINKGVYDDEILDIYTEEEISTYLDTVLKDTAHDRDLGMVHSQVEIMIDQNLARVDGKIIEMPQEMYAFIALYASIEDNDIKWAYRYYQKMAIEKTISPSTAILANLRKKRGSSTSCETLGNGDSLDQICHNNTMAKKEASNGTGLGWYAGLIRAKGSEIAGHPNVARGPIPIIREMDSSIVTVDQLGIRKSNIAVTIDVWHLDLADFLNVKSENGDQRSKANTIFRALTFPDIFMRRMVNREPWTLFDPYTAKNHLGFDLASVHNEEFEKAYTFLESLDLGKMSRKVNARELFVEFLKHLPEDGDPYALFRDTANAKHMNSHAGMIYSSNLCSEILGVQEFDGEATTYYDEEKNVYTTTRSVGYTPTCNLLSLNFAKLTEENIDDVARVAVRFIDNVISGTKINNPSAQRYNEMFRSAGIGCIGYAHWCAINNLRYGAENTLKETENMLIEITSSVIKHSSLLAKERGAYPMYKGSKWESGDFFGIPYDELPSQLQEVYNDYVSVNGLRNGYLFAIAPNTSTSLVMNETSSIYPAKNLIVVKDTINTRTITVTPDADKYPFSYQKSLLINLSLVDDYLPTMSLFAKYTDQSISNEVPFVPSKDTPKDLYDYYVGCWMNGIKTVYYCRINNVSCTACAN